MPKTLFDADGNEIQVPDDAELVELRASAQAAADAKAKLASYEQDDKVQNVRKLADSRDRLAAHLKSLGKTVDPESGTVTEPVSTPSFQDVEQVARKSSEQFFIDQALDVAKSGLDDNERKLFDKMFSKAAFGEEVNPRTISRIISETKTMAFGETTTTQTAPTGSRSIFRRSFGGVPEAFAGEEKPLTPLQADFIRRNGGERAFPIKPRSR